MMIGPRLRAVTKDKGMTIFLRRPLGIALGALATTSLGGCYYGDVNGYGPAYAGNDCAARYGDAYYDYDPYSYGDGYGYDCYDGGDYGAGFVNIGFGGGWYDNYYYPGYGLWLFDNYNNRYPLRGQYLNYWGGRRAWWKHHGKDRDWRPRGNGPGRGDGHWNNGPGRGDGPHGDGRPGGGRPGGWDGHGRGDNDGPRGTRPPRPGNGSGTPPTTNPTPIDPGRGDGRPGGGRPGGWGGPGRGDNDGPRGTRPPRPGAGGTNPVPPTSTTPVRPGRPDRGPGNPRPAQQWQNHGGGGNSVVAPRPAPSQAAPPPRSAPPATRSTPPPQSRPAPAPRPRIEPPSKVREQ